MEIARVFLKAAVAADARVGSGVEFRSIRRKKRKESDDPLTPKKYSHEARPYVGLGKGIGKDTR